MRKIWSWGTSQEDLEGKWKAVINQIHCFHLKIIKEPMYWHHYFKENVSNFKQSRNFGAVSSGLTDLGVSGTRNWKLPKLLPQWLPATTSCSYGMCCKEWRIYCMKSGNYLAGHGSFTCDFKVCIKGIKKKVSKMLSCIACQAVIAE